MEDPRCAECGFTANVKLMLVVPYNFGEKTTRWLCAPYTGRQCVAIRYEKYRKYLLEKSGDAQTLAVGSPSRPPVPPKEPVDA